LGILLEKIVQEKESREATRELRELTKTKPSHRAYLGQGKTRAIPLLVSLLLSSDSETQEHAVTALLNLSIHDANKTAIAAQRAIPCIVQVLRDGGTMEARGNAAAALFSLSAVDENKAKIGASGALPALVDLLSDGNAMAKKDSASALFNLCIHRENRIPCVRAGMIPVLLKLVSNHSEGLVDESLSLLAMVAAHHEAAEAMGNAGAVPCLMDIIKDGSQHPRNKENAVVTLQAICLNDRSHFKKMRGDRNGCINALIDLSESGTSRAKRKASAILDRMMKQEHMSTI
jgi:HEAT repeat protein